MTANRGTAARKRPEEHPHIGQPFALVMQLEDPRKLPELLTWLDEHRDPIDSALESLDYVHYSRFVPLPDAGRLLIVTEFDGRQKDYVMDFAAVLDGPFSKVLSYMKDRPRLPVRLYPDEFYDYVERNSRLLPGVKRQPRLFRAYPDKSVLDITTVGGREKADARGELPSDTPALETGKLQANILRGYFSREDNEPAYAWHAGVNFCGDAEQARQFVKALLKKDEKVSITANAQWTKQDKPAYCLNIGFTHAGLGKLGLPKLALDRFPRAFKEGAAAREISQELDFDADPSEWGLGNPQKPDNEVVHALLLLHTEKKDELDARVADLKRLRDDKASFQAEFVYECEPATFDDGNTARVHFGYVDSISQPRIQGLAGERPADGGQTESPAGDFILGASQINARGGNFIGELPPALGDYATYAAVRVIHQDVKAFDKLRKEIADGHGLDPDSAAAQLMGRDFEGQPLTPTHSASIDDFSYVDADEQRDDSRGQHCPFGAHIRRMNPRNATVIGIPALRRVIRRGLPYGPAYQEGEKDDVKRGLFGIFLCGDLESQYEFLLRVWANGDVATVGIRNTVDPFVGSRKDKRREFRLRDGSTIALPKLTRTEGSVYLFVPGMPGLEWIARAGWATEPRRVPDAKSRAFPAASPPESFSAFDPAFQIDPYHFYAKLRNNHPILKVPTHHAWWVLSHDLVTWCCEQDELFTKPARRPGAIQAMMPQPQSAAAEDTDQPTSLKTVTPASAVDMLHQFDPGLFYMQKERHRQVRKPMEKVLAAATKRVKGFAQAQAEALLDGPLRRGRIDIVADYAVPLTTSVFMDLMGVPKDHRAGVDAWTRGALNGHDVGADPRLKREGGTSAMALRAYFHGLLLGSMETSTSTGDVPLMCGIRAFTDLPPSEQAKCPAHAKKLLRPKPPLSTHEAMQTAVNFVLGGYLSTEFLITTGVLNLLRRPNQLEALRNDPDGLMPGALEEMLRYDAPFQMADRTVTRDCSFKFDGKTITLMAGDDVTLVYGSANHDAKVWADDPDGFDIRRDPGNPVKHFGFGPASRYCIGAGLARTVTAIALRTLLDRCPNLGASTRFQPGEWLADPYYRSLRSLQVLLD